MRKLEKVIIWPVYFNSTKNRREGRRVPKNKAVKSPKILELQDAIEELGLKYETIPEANYPKTPWIKTGMILVEKKSSKEQVIKQISDQLLKMRSEILKHP